MTQRARRFKETRSSRPRREPYDVVLIVCEGAKTEPNYLSELITELRLSSANVEVVGEQCGSSPATIVQFAIDRARSSNDYDRVYCVFDRDIHPDFNAAVDRIRSMKRGPVFSAITSNPCFEYWLLLHLKETLKPYLCAGNKSAGDLVLADLKRELPAYGKGVRGVYSQLRKGLDDAIQRASRGRSQGIDNPYTDVDLLVTYLRSIKA